MMSRLRVILQASPCKAQWRRFQIPRSMLARPCSLYTCTYKTRNRACEYMAAWREQKPGCFLTVTCVECLQLWCQWHSRLGLDALRTESNNPLFLCLFKYGKPFSPLALLRYNWPKSKVYIMMIWYTYILWNDYHGAVWKGVFFTNFNLLKWCHAEISQRSPKFQILWTCSLLFFVSNRLFTKIDPRTANYFCESEHSGICIFMFASSSVASYSGIFRPSLQIAEEVLLGDQLASVSSAVNPADQVRQQMVLPDTTALLPWAWVILCCRGGLCTADAAWHP